MRLSVLRLTRQSLLATFLVATCGVSSHGGAAWAGEKASDEPETVAPVTFGAATTPAKSSGVAVGEPEVLAPIGFGAASAKTQVAPLNVSGTKPASAAPIGFDLSNTARDVALTQVKAGTLTLEQAWQSGALTYDNIADLFDHPADPWVINENKTDGGLHRQLITLLLQHEGARMQSPDKVSLRMRLWLADYYWSQRDAKAVAVGQKLLNEFPPPALGPQMIAYQANERIAWFYRDQRQPQKSAETWLHWKAYQGGPDWALINAKLEAARELEKVGPENAGQVSQLRQEIVAEKDGWITALVYHDEYDALLAAGQTEAARRALSQPIEAITNISQGHIAQNAWLANIAYQSGDLNETLRLTKEALAQNMEGVGQSSVKGLLEQARELYNRAGGWRTQPIQTDTKEVVFQANLSQPDQPLYARFHIKTYGDTSITASVDNPNIQARVLPVNNWQHAGLNVHEEEMEVIVQSNSLNKFKDVPLTLSSATRGKTTTIRLSLVEKSA